MNAAAKFGIALMVLALFVFQPFSKCFAMPAAKAHHCCPAPSKAECKTASCACTSTDSATAPIAVSKELGQQQCGVLVSAYVHEFAIPSQRIGEPEDFHLPLNDRFVILHQFLI
jgi:hypothetical protein